jgi:peptide/nickel transport system ATP-binding protein
VKGAPIGPLLDVVGLSVGYGCDSVPVEIVSKIDFHIERGEALGLVGESGSGKSTIAAAVLGLLPEGLRELAGKVTFEGRDLGALSPKARRRVLGPGIGSVFQDPFTSLNPSLQIGDQVAEPLKIHKNMSDKLARDRTLELLSDVGMPDPRKTARSYQHQLSGGMRQRALIAIALACEPSLLILDEPTTALDAEVEAQFLDLLQNLRTRFGLSFLFISHNLAVVHRLCDRVAVLYAGQIIETGDAKEVFVKPDHPYTRALLACIPRISTRHSRTLEPIPGGLPLLGAKMEGCRFAPRCAHVQLGCDSPQPMIGLGAGQVRCWRVGAIQSEPIPHDTVAKPKIHSRKYANVLIRTTDLSKSYPQGGAFFSNFTWSRTGSRLLYEPKRFDALKSVSIDVRRGEILGLVGQSGSGKSSFGRALLRIDEPTSGSIEFDGSDITTLPAADLHPFRKRAQMVFQNPDGSLNPRISVGAAIARPLRLFRTMPEEKLQREVDRLLELVRLPATFKRRFPHELSGGEKQRVGLARALASNPELIVCDEPVSALDVSVQAAIVNLIERLRTELNLSVLFISHDLGVVSHLCDRIAVMYRGALCEMGPTEEILTSPKHPYTRRLLAAVGGVSLPEILNSPANGASLFMRTTTDQ